MDNYTEKALTENKTKPNYGKSAISRYFLKIPFYSFGKIGVETHRKPFRKHPDQSAYFNISRVGGGLKKGLVQKARKENEQITHTAELHTAIEYDEYRTLIKHQNARLERDGEGKTHCHIRTLESYGITDVRPSRAKMRNGFWYYYCIVIINLQRLVNDGKRTIETYNNEQDFLILFANFAKYIETILPLRTNLNEWSLQRIDYNIDLKLPPREVEQYITLLQRGDKNYSWHIHEMADETKKRKQSKHGNRKKTHPTGSVIFDNKQYSVNIYNKYLERSRVQKERGITDTAELQASEGVLRIEIQVKRNKLNTIKQRIKRDFDFEGKPIEFFARYDIAIPVIMKALESITGRADYITFERAKERVERAKMTERTRTSVIDFLSLVTHTKSLWRAKEKFTGDIQTETILSHLNRLNINPVTIPVSFKRDSMENLFDKVAVLFYEQADQSETI